MKNETKTFRIDTIERATDKAIGVRAWDKTGAQVIAWFARSYRDGSPLSWTEQIGGATHLTTAAWLLDQKADLTFSRGPVPAPARPTQARHVDCIIGDLNGAYEQLAENVPGARERIARLQAELEVAERRGPNDGPYLPPGYDLDPYFDAAEYFDGESEIASDCYGIPLDEPNFWTKVGDAMIAQLHHAAVRKLGR